MGKAKHSTGAALRGGPPVLRHSRMAVCGPLGHRPPRRAAATSPLHIVHSESSCGWGGQEIRILTESEGLVRRGHDVRLVCAREAPIFDAARRRGLPVEALPIAKRDLRGLRAVRRWLKSNRVDVINTHSSTDSWLFAVASKVFGPRVPIVRTRHISAVLARDPFTRWVYTRAADAVVTTGENTRRAMLAHNRFPENRVLSVPTGIDTERFAPGNRKQSRQKLALPMDKLVVGIVATIRSWKGHRYLVDAVHALRRDDVHLLIVGDGPSRSAVEERIAELNLTGRVTLPGNQDDVVPWLQAMDVFALPSHANEGVPQSVLQAMACGLPVVSTTAGSIEEAVVDKQTGWIVPPLDPNALAAALGTLLDDETLRRRFGSEGRHRAVERFGIDRMLDRMESLFHQVVAARP